MGRSLYSIIKHIDRAEAMRKQRETYQGVSQLEIIASYEYNEYKKHHLFHGLPNFKDYMGWRYYNPDRSVMNTKVDLIKAEIVS